MEGACGGGYVLRKLGSELTLLRSLCRLHGNLLPMQGALQTSVMNPCLQRWEPL